MKAWLAQPIFGRFTAGWMACLLLLAFLAALLPFLFITDPEVRVAVVDLLMPLYALAAAALLYLAGRQSLRYAPRLGRAWQLLGLAVLCAAIGEIIWLILDLLALSPFPSIADLFYLLFYPLLLAGILLMPGRPGSPAERLTKLLEITVIVLAMALLVWNFIIAPALAEMDSNDTLATAISLAYPLFDLFALLALLTLGFRHPQIGSPRARIFLAVGLALLILADTLFSLEWAVPAGPEAGVAEIAWLWSYLFLCMAGICQRLDPGASAPPPPFPIIWFDRLLRNYLPAVLLLIAYVLLAQSHYQRLPMSFNSLVAWVGALAGLIVAVQVLYARENQRLQQEMEARVEARTQALNSISQALRDSERKFRSVVEQAQDGMVLTDEKGVVIEWNAAMERITGLQASQALGRLIWDVQFQLSPPERKTEQGYAGLKESIYQGLQTGQAPWMGVSVENAHILPDGERRYVQAVMAPIATERGWMLSSVIRDVTERKKAEMALLIKDRAIATSLSAIAIADTRGRLTYVNAAFLQIWGYADQAEVLGRSSLEFWHDPAQAQQVVLAMSAQGQWLGQMTAVKKDGARFEAELTASLIRDENGQPAGLMASFVDITERSRAAELFKLNEMRLNSLLTLSQQLYGMRVEDIAQAALEEAVRLTGSAIGYCHLVNEDQEAIELVNWSRQALEGCRAVSDKHYPLSNAGIWADCVREQRPVVHNDYPALRDKRGLPEGHSPLLRHASAPVVEGGKVRLIMGVGNKPGDYDEADLLQLQLVANETWKLVQRKRIEERLQYSEERFRSMVSNVPGVIYRCERHMPWHMLYVSDEIEKLSGYPVSDFLEGRRFFADLLLPEDLGDELISRQVEAHLPYEIEYRIRRADGQIRWVFERGIASYGPQGEVQWLDGVMIDITERMALQQQLEELATTDPLTGVFNRRCFMERLEDEVQRARRYGSPLSLLIFDLDLFKQINDSYGHDAGDMALKQVATLTRQGLRQVDSLGRLGGEEFAVLLPNTRLDEAAILAERLRARIAAKQLEARDGSFHVTVSGGVTQFYSTIPDGDTLMKHADRALYQAKSAGRNCVRKYQNNLHAL